jgi:hypothetical protein
MDSKIKQALIKGLSKASSATYPVTFKQKGKTVAVLIPIEDNQEFCAEREEKLEQLKIELNGILTLIRSRLKHQQSAEIETQLAAHRQKIEQETN